MNRSNMSASTMSGIKLKLVRENRKHVSPGVVRNRTMTELGSGHDSTAQLIHSVLIGLFTFDNFKPSNKVGNSRNYYFKDFRKL